MGRKVSPKIVKGKLPTAIQENLRSFKGISKKICYLREELGGTFIYLKYKSTECTVSLTAENTHYEQLYANSILQVFDIWMLF